MPTLPIDAQFDVDFVNAMAHREVHNKHLYRPNSYLHKWWARRCGTTFRAILKHLVEDETLRDYYQPKGLQGKIVLDPMMGGGTTLHEAIRLGANVVGVDIDPIPYLQARATLSETDLNALHTHFDAFHQTLKAEHDRKFVTSCPDCQRQAPLRFTLYGQRRRCACRRSVVLVDSLTLRQFKDGSRIHITPDSRAVCRDETVLSRSALPPQTLIERSNKCCPHCGEKFREQRELPWHRRLQPYALFGKCGAHGEFFKPLDLDDYARLVAFNRIREQLFNSADFQIQAAPKSQSLLSRGITNYLDLFSTRQLILLRSSIDLLATLEPDIQLNLAMIVSTALEFNSLLCGYKGWLRSRPGTIKQTFVRHAYSLPYTVLENNPLFGHKRSGTLDKLFHSRIVRGRQWAQQPQERNGVGWKPLREHDFGQETASLDMLNQQGQRFMLHYGSSADLDLPANSIDFIVTDPPYYDSVQYGDLARFFTVWLRKLHPHPIEWDYPLANAAINQHDDGDQFETTLAQIFTQCRRVLKPNGRMVFTFHHWKPEAWAALTYALSSADFRLVNYYIVQAENPKSIHIQNQIALQHDVVLVCAQEATVPPTTPDNRQQTAVAPAHVPKPSAESRSRAFSNACARHLRQHLHQQHTLNEMRASWLQFVDNYCRHATLAGWSREEVA